MLGVYVLGSVVINGSPLLGSYLETWWTRRYILCVANETAVAHFLFRALAGSIKHPSEPE